MQSTQSQLNCTQYCVNHIIYYIILFLREFNLTNNAARNVTYTQYCQVPVQESDSKQHVNSLDRNGFAFAIYFNFGHIKIII